MSMKEKDDAQYHNDMMQFESIALDNRSAHRYDKEKRIGGFYGSADIA